MHRSNIHGHSGYGNFEDAGALNHDHWHIPGAWERESHLPKVPWSHPISVEEAEVAYKEPGLDPSNLSFETHRNSRQNFTKNDRSNKQKTKRTIEEVLRQLEESETARKKAEETAGKLRVQLFHVLVEVKKNDEAEVMYNEIMINSDKSPSKNDKTLGIRQTYAGVLAERGDLQEAERISREVWDTMQGCQDLAPEAIRASHRQLCSILASLGRHKDAEHMHMHMYQKEPKDIWALENGDKACEMLAEQKMYEKAHRTQHEVWEERQKQCGPRDHLTIGSALRDIRLMEKIIAMDDDQNISEPERDRNNHNKAALACDVEVMLRKVWSNRLVPEPNNDVLNCGHKLGAIMFKKGEFLEAETALSLVWNGKKQNIGEKEPSTLSSASILGKALHHQGAESRCRAIPILKDVWQDRKSVLGEGNPDTISSGEDLVQAYCSGSDWADAESIYEWIIDQKTCKLGRTAPATVEARWNLGQVLSKQGKTRDRACEAILAEVYHEWKAQRPDSSLTLECGNMLAQSLLTQDGRQKDALDLIREVFTQQEAHIGEHLSFTESGRLYGALLLEAPDPDFIEAERVLRLTSESQGQGPEEETVRMLCGHLLGQVLHEQRKYSEAKAVLTKVADAQRIALPPESPEVSETCGLLTMIEKEIEKGQRRPPQKRPGRFYYPRYSKKKNLVVHVSRH